ncbi:hypothetical protein HK097_007768 [Rhizophlyctis rosea]|uniref:NmrA-like domain-containing protein n=1 Tax=Rhizophlyctis rosea TaxID=64517 RepID=A0AAD5SB90_9FUNG|nr:hypothetical protein HK097_007768 [Rhizophlyctis rosea]
MAHPPTEPFHRILVLCGTGTLGSAITTALLNSNKFTQIGILSSPRTSPRKSALLNHFESLGATLHTADLLDIPSLTPIFQFYSVILSCVPSSLISHQQALIDLAISYQVQRFYPSDYGADWVSDPLLGALSPYYIPKAQIHNYILDKAGKGLISYTSMATGPFGEVVIMPINEVAMQGIDVNDGKAKVLGDGSKKVGFTTLADIGKAVVATLLNPSLSHNKVVRFTSFTASFRSIINTYAKFTGKDFKVDTVGSVELTQKMEKAIEEGDDEKEALVDVMAAIFERGQGLVVDDGLFPDVPRQTMEELILGRLEREGIPLRIGDQGL